MLFGPKITNVFRSRWQALFWAASVLLTAYCSVPAPETHGGGQPKASAEVHGKHSNPWAKDSPSSP